MENNKIVRLVDKSRDEMPVLYEDEKVPYWIKGFIDTPVGRVRVMKTTLERRDRQGGYMARWGINRDNYTVSPGLYAVGNPDASSEVLVTANYKLTVDKLRAELSGMNLWIVVLDTKGINVWCAAGKGTFGTAELTARIRKIQLKKIVEHKRIILPQLGASGVSAHVVQKLSEFKVTYGPVRAKDIKEFLGSGMAVTEDMREVNFNFMDRLVLTPIELMHSLKYIPIICIVFFILNLIKPGGIDIGTVLYKTLFNSLPYFIALILGAVCLPIILPYLPFRAFALKGCVLGVLLSAFTLIFNGFFRYDAAFIVYTANSLLLTSVVSFLGLNFTGCTTYTSLSGVKLETQLTTIIAAAASLIGIILLIINTVLKYI